MGHAWNVFGPSRLPFLPLATARLAIVWIAAFAAGLVACHFLKGKKFFDGQPGRWKAALRVTATILFLVASVVMCWTGVVLVFRSLPFANHAWDILKLPRLTILPLSRWGFATVWLVALAAGLGPDGS
jgi:hypothetical protein